MTKAIQFWHPWLAAACLCCILTGTAYAEKRVALVIGNGAYQFLASLDNPANDARLIGQTLSDLNFDLVGDRPLLDLDLDGMRNAIRQFGDALTTADVGLFFYAGHGIEHAGTNYLIPVNANLNSENDVSFELISADLPLQQMQYANNKLNMMILDACRNNPFAGRGFRAVSRGLGRMEAPAGTLISFATRPGAVAADGTGQNSPYSAALAEAMQTENLSLFEVFNKVGVTVAANSRGSQEPWLSSSPISGEFFFAGRGGEPEPANTAPQVGKAELDLAFWNAVKDSGNEAELREYLSTFPEGRFAGLARLRLKELESPAASKRTPTENPAATAAVTAPESPEGERHSTSEKDAGNNGDLVRDGKWNGKMRFYSADGLNESIFDIEFEVEEKRIDSWFQAGGISWKLEARLSDDGTIDKGQLYDNRGVSVYSLEGTIKKSRGKYRFSNVEILAEPAN